MNIAARAALVVALCSAPLAAKDVYVPIAGSSPGANNAYFRTDLRIFNPSAAKEVQIEARYLPLGADNRGAEAKSITVRKREMVSLNDVVSSLFLTTGYGAIRLTSADEFVATSRTYTASQCVNGGAYGQFIPTFDTAAARKEGVILQLSVGAADLSSGSRSNIGWTNPNAVPVTITAKLFGGDNTQAGGAATFALLPYSSTIAGVRGLIPGVPNTFVANNAWVSFDATQPVFGFGSVVDNRSDDQIFIDALAASGGAASQDVYVPIAGSAAGANNTFFRTDLRVFNPSTAKDITIDARYLPLGSDNSGAPSRPMTIRKREMASFDDVAGAFFGSGGYGAIRLTSSDAFLVTSRTYTASQCASGGAYGQFVPAFPRTAARTKGVILQLSLGPSDLSGGSRSNIGWTNPNPAPVTITAKLFGDVNTQIGSTSTLTLPPYSSTISGVRTVIRDVASSLTATNAWVSYEADQAVFGFGSVVDNRSDDQIFIGAQDDDPSPTLADVWSPIATANAPSPDNRIDHTAVWTGNAMIVWGGFFFGTKNTGGAYDPRADSWTATPLANAPEPREYHTAVWTGLKMIVWGGQGSAALNTGGAYDPVSDSWSATAVAGAPEGRSRHTAVWTGSKMIVWGGLGSGRLNTGGIYDPATNSWTPVSTVGAPAGRSNHTAVWTGSKMIVWGGYDGGRLNTGGIYDPATDSWKAMSTTNAPSGRSIHSAVWTGSKMIVWGGSGGGADFTCGLVIGDVEVNTGGVYDPATDSWTSTSPSPLTPRRSHTAVWTGSKMIVWGGENTSCRRSYGNGAVYDPESNSWTATSSTGAPAARDSHTAVWTGRQMIVWGGATGGASYR